MSLFYFDNNATTRVLPKVMEAMRPWFCEQYGNPSSSHLMGQYARQAMITARSAVAGFLHASPADIIFTSGATESNHMAILGALAANPTRKRVVTSAVEHSSTLRLLNHLSQAQGIDLVTVPVNASGTLDLDALAAAVTPDTALVTLMHANNETGILFPIAEAAAIAHGQGALFHTDAAQTAGKLQLNVQNLGCDLLGFSGHKLHAPKGVGVLFVRKGLSIEPLLHGHQERNRRGGSENLPGIVGLDVACRLAQEHMSHHAEKIPALRDKLEQGLLQRIPGTRINGAGPRVPNTTSIRFSAYSGEELLHRLSQAGVMASQGSACTAGGTEPSHVLVAMGLSREDALSTLRFSLSRESTEAEVDVLLEAMSAISRSMNRLTEAA